MPAVSERTQVAVIGAGPAGLTLCLLLRRAGLDCVVLERHTREHCEGRVRAGVLEHDIAGLFAATGAGERMLREGMVHGGIELRFLGEAHRIPMAELCGRSVTIYGQQELVKDLDALLLDAGADLRFEAEGVAVHDHTGDRPMVTFRHGGREHALECRAVAGCDGFHGVCRETIPASQRRSYAREYPYAWLGILARAAPATEELIYATHQRGFALHSMRSSAVSRLYLQVDAEERLEDWPDDRVWEELQLRLGGPEGWRVNPGPTLEKGITAMRSFVSEPMQHGNLFLAGDASHIVPPTGAKGLNLAVHDVVTLAEALARWLLRGDRSALDGYSQACLARVWRAQEFAHWMTRLLHVTGDPFDHALQLARLRYVTTSQAAARSLAENYTGLPRPWPPPVAGG